MGTTTRSITIPSVVNPTALLGPMDEVLREVQRGFPDLTIVARGNTISVISHSADSEGSAVAAESFIGDLIDGAVSGSPIDADAAHRLLDARGAFSSSDSGTQSGREKAGASEINEVRTAESMAPAEVAHTSSPGGGSEGRLPRVITFASGVPVRPKTPGQIDYVNCIDHNVITFGVGPAGTGKTYLAVAKAVQAFESKQVRRIILTRPAVEAGESLGFLPGTLSEKIDPYLRPLYDALSDMLGAGQMRRYIADGTIEVAPLAYMRGRTLNDAFVILDEAQNTTEQQMKMFLTRLGFNTTMVVTGDVTQIDVSVRQSGLRSIEAILKGIPTISFVHLTAGDVVRHSLVGKIVEAYERHYEESERRYEEARHLRGESQHRSKERS
ncbi:MAG: PhoH family protein [Bifidobacteriaceae bacterium]|nr:PhoH family protein [Bifidobacteriaceae bacterium]